MNTDNVSEVLLFTAKSFFERGAFLFVDPYYKNAELLDGGDLLASSIKFDGPFSGIFFITVSRELAKIIISNMLGLNSDADKNDDSKLYDGIGECLNIICGNFLPYYGGSEQVFKIFPPQRISNNEFNNFFKKGKAKVKVELIADGYLVKVGFTLDEKI